MSLLVRCPDFRGLSNACKLIEMGPWTSILIIKVFLLVRCPDFRSLNVCTLGLLTSVLIIKVSLLVRCPDFRSLNVCTLGLLTSVLIIKVSIFQNVMLCSCICMQETMELGIRSGMWYRICCIRPARNR